MDLEGFRCVARSSPWLWRTVRFTHDDQDLPPVRAWIRRPQAMRVETLDGHLLQADPGQPFPVHVALFAIGADDQADMPQRPVWWTHPMATRPPLGPDGLVHEPRRPAFGTVFDDPMWQNYRWVAMLDPVELADDSDGRPAVDIDDLLVGQRHGRLTVSATVRPRDGYDPRCSCCPLLPSRPAALAEGFPDPDGPFADAHRVALDAATGICVSAREIGGPRDGRGFEIVLEAVDEPMPDGLFTRRRPPVPTLQRLLGRPRPGVSQP